ncbi:MAG: NADH-quinone oxidoreductase subunit J, partial [Phycisphaerae bacterium]|nr:NADH-quinone oxidoreductase subunit J [Phycisphaerae bacterium]
RKGIMGKAGALGGLIAVAGLTLSILIRSKGTLGSEYFWFCLFGAIAIIASALMIVQSKAIYSALFFMLSLLAVSMLLMLAHATFLSVALIIIYAGAILVVYVFVLMLSGQEKPAWYDKESRMPLLAIVIGFILLGGLLQLMLSGGPVVLPEKALEISGSVPQLGTELFHNHVLALEIAGVILLIAAVGGIALVKNSKEQEQ